MSRATVEKLDIPQSIGGQKVKGFITWLGLEIRDESVNAVGLVHGYMREVARLACGECGMGYNGVRVISGTLERMTAGRGEEGDIDLLVSLANGIHENAGCDFCRQAVKPVMDALAYHLAAFEAAVKEHAAIKKKPYITNVTAPCMEACPIHQDVPGYIQLTRNGLYDDALEVIRRTNCLPGVLGRTCVAFCEKNCVRNDIDQPLAIRALKRVPSDMGKAAPVQKKMAKNGGVSIIGCGPAGLAAADYLAATGFKVNIIDDHAAPGGMAAVGIPPYRLPRSVIEKDVDIILSHGADIELNRNVEAIDKDMREAKATLVATGAHKSKAAGIEGWSEGCTGFMEGVSYLAGLNSGQAPFDAGRVIIVGGGNTAIDCARAAVRTGAKEVTVVYRRSRVEMPARADEVDAAGKEGVKFHFLALPVRLITEADRVVSVECRRMELGEPDASGRRRPIPVKGSEFVIPADLVLSAIGEEPGLSFLPRGVELTAWGSSKTGRDGRSSLPWLYAAGDCATGPATIVEAMAGGRKAARSIEASVRGETQAEPVSEQLHKLGMERRRFGPSPSQKERRQPEEIGEKARTTTFDEVEQRFSLEAARKEASRCLRCYRVMVAIS